VTDPVDAPASPTAAAPARDRLGLEVLAVLGVSLGISGLSAILYYIRAEVTVSGGIGNTTAIVIGASKSHYEWLDSLDRLLDLLSGTVPPLLALLLLARTPGGRGFGVGFDLRERVDVLRGAGFALLIGIPGLALVYTAHVLGLSASLDVVDFPNVWYRVPYLVLSAFQNGLSEEIIVVAYLLTRLRQMGWTDSRALAASAVLRGSYHLYQGYGGFLGNMVMGLVFGWWFQRRGRVMPLVIAHFLLDAASFIGYVYLHKHLSWI
jgi:membrane protease YdiL (CAAX protease family)